MSLVKSQRQSRQTKQKKQKKLIDIFKKMNIKQKDQLKQLLYIDENKNMSEDINLDQIKNKEKYYKFQSPKRKVNYQKFEPNQFDQNDIRDLYSILEMTIKQNVVKIDPPFNSQSQNKSLNFNKMTLKQLSNIPYQFLFGGLIQFTTYNRLIIREDESKKIIEIALQLFTHCQELRFPEINLKFPQFKYFFKSVQNIRFPNLRSLNLQNCAIESIQSLSFLDLPVLGVLNLESNMISRIDALAKCFFQNKFFETLYLRGNLINDFSKFNRINIKKLITFRLNGQVLFGQKQKDVQSQDLSFLVKKCFSVQMIRTCHQKRIIQQKVIDCLYRLDQKIYIYKS